jgi:acyl-CoA reductase-like NAD-dependent aldehyde dehydrogenase
VRNLVIMEPVGPVAGFSPWNFPVTQAVRKIAASAGCRLLHHHQMPRGDKAASKACM